MYKIKITLLSDTLIGSAEGYGAIIDTDVVFDEFGFPYIPSRRIKGILRDSAVELLGMLKSAGISKYNQTETDKIFGEKGNTDNREIFKISNLYLPDYNENKKFIKSIIKNNDLGLTKDSIIDYFTTIHRQSSIDSSTGVVKEHSLRTSRVLKKDLCFEGELDFPKDYKTLMGLVCANVKKIGTMRNRGLGKIEVEINKEIMDNSLKELEEVCMK